MIFFASRKIQFIKKQFLWIAKITIPVLRETIPWHGSNILFSSVNRQAFLMIIPLQAYVLSYIQIM